MSIVTKTVIIEEVKTFYEQYLYIKDVHNVYLDIFDVFEKQDKAHNFLVTAGSACIDSYQITIARLYDTHNQSTTIRTLITTCKNNIALFQNQVEVNTALSNFENSLQNEPFQSLLDVIRHRRNKYIAHNDPDYFFHSDPKDLAVQDNKSYALPHLWSLINDTGALLEVLWHNLSTDDISLKCQYNRDLADLFPNETLSVMKPIG